MPWSRTDYRLAEIWSVLARKKHPAVPKSQQEKKEAAERDAALARTEARERERQEAIRRGEIN